jgi:hypothetical protein
VADLVRRVAVGGHAVGADDHRVDVAAREPRRRCALGQHRHRDAGLLELPGRQSRPLQQRARLAREHLDLLSGGCLGVDDAERRAPSAAGHEPAGVADRQQAPRVGELGAAVLADGPARLAVLDEDRQRFGLRVGGGEHAVDGPPRLTAVGRAARIMAAPSSRRPARAARTTPNAPHIPIAGAPRTASRRIAPTTSSGVVSRRIRSSPGSSVWSMISTASPLHRTAARMWRTYARNSATSSW